MAPDPTTVTAAGITGIFVLLGAIVTGLYSVKASRQARDAVREHVTAEGPTLDAFASTLERVEGKIDSCLVWQGKHDAYHIRQESLDHTPHHP